MKSNQINFLQSHLLVVKTKNNTKKDNQNKQNRGSSFWSYSSNLSYSNVEEKFATESNVQQSFDVLLKKKLKTISVKDEKQESSIRFLHQYWA